VDVARCAKPVRFVVCGPGIFAIVAKGGPASTTATTGLDDTAGSAPLTGKAQSIIRDLESLVRHRKLRVPVDRRLRSGIKPIDQGGDLGAAHRVDHKFQLVRIGEEIGIRHRFVEGGA